MRFMASIVFKQNLGTLACTLGEIIRAEKQSLVTDERPREEWGGGKFILVSSRLQSRRQSFNLCSRVQFRQQHRLQYKITTTNPPLRQSKITNGPIFAIFPRPKKKRERWPLTKLERHHPPPWNMVVNWGGILWLFYGFLCPVYVMVFFFRTWTYSVSATDVNGESYSGLVTVISVDRQLLVSIDSY